MNPENQNHNPEPAPQVYPQSLPPRPPQSPALPQYQAPPYSPYSNTPPATSPIVAPPSSGLAIASLVLGIVAFIFGYFIIGGIIGIGAIICGVMALKRKQSKVLSILGIVLSVLALLATALAIHDLATRSTYQAEVAISESELVMAGSPDESVVRFLYPKNWTVEKDSDGSGVTRYTDYYNQANKAINSSLVYVYQLGEVKTLTDDERKAQAQVSIANNDNSIKQLINNYIGCDNAKDIAMSEFNQNGLIGVKTDFSCELTTDKTATYGKIIISKDNLNIGHNFVLFSTSKDRWDVNQTVFNKMLGSIVWNSDFKSSECKGTTVKTATGSYCKVGGSN